jgi:hypothetical protein
MQSNENSNIYTISDFTFYSHGFALWIYVNLKTRQLVLQKDNGACILTYSLSEQNLCQFKGRMSSDSDLYKIYKTEDGCWWLKNTTVEKQGIFKEKMYNIKILDKWQAKVVRQLLKGDYDKTRL